MFTPARRHAGSAASRAGLAGALLIAACLIVTPGLARAQQAATDPTAEGPSQTTTLSGFRSAKFGMGQDEVREAIRTDFGLDDDAIQEGVNTVERTGVLSVSVPDILEEGGTAQLSYIFGYRSKALIQVGILWARATDPDITDEMLYANGDVLRAHFMSAGYLPDSISTDVVLDNGILLFRGSDDSGHTVILLLQGQFEESGEGQARLAPASLTLLYSANPDDPDIMKIDDGNF